MTQTPSDLTAACSPASLRSSDPQQSAAALIRKDGGRSHALAVAHSRHALAPADTSHASTSRPAGAGRWQPLAAALVFAALLMFGLVQFRVVNIQPVGQVAGGTPDVALTLAKNSGTLRTVLATGGMSPRGRAASGVDGAQRSASPIPISTARRYRRAIRAKRRSGCVMP